MITTLVKMQQLIIKAMKKQTVANNPTSPLYKKIETTDGNYVIVIDNTNYLPVANELKSLKT